MKASDVELKEREIQIPMGAVQLEGTLTLPSETRGIVLFAHGSGSSRHSRRNRFVAGKLQEGGWGTLLFDLLTSEEEAIDTATGHLRFDIELLAGRLYLATQWVGRQTDLQRHRVAYFGASTGAAAALIAAARLPEPVAAVISRGGRPDLAGPALADVKAPTVLIVGGDDAPVIPLNEKAMRELRCEKSLEIVPGATHLFEEPGALENVAERAARWLGKHL